MNCDPSSLASAATCFQCIPPGMQSGVRSYLLCQWANKPTVPIIPCNHPVVVDWVNRIVAGEGLAYIPSDPTIQAVCDFCDALDAAGIMDKMLAVNPVIPDSLQAMRYPLIYQPGNGNSPWINLNFVPADLDNNGILADTNKAMNTGFVPSAHWGAAVESGGETAYEYSGSTQAANPEVEIGVEETFGGQTYFFELRTYDPTLPEATGYCWDGASQVNSFNPIDTPGWYSMNRTAANVSQFYLGNSITPGSPVLLDTNVADQTGTHIPACECWFMATGICIVAPDLLSSKRVSFVAIHEGLDETLLEVTAFYNAVQTLRMALGGGFI